MLEQVRQDILAILKEGIIAIKNENTSRLRDLSNQTTHDSSIFQDENSITIAVVMYALNKIFGRSSYREYNDWKIFNKIVLESLEKSYDELSNNNIASYQSEIKKILEVINKLSSHLKNYIKDLFQDASIKKGSRIHEHGVSIGKAAELLMISKWELMDYAGKTGIYDREENISMKIEDRIKFTRGLFK